MAGELRKKKRITRRLLPTYNRLSDDVQFDIDCQPDDIARHNLEMEYKLLQMKRQIRAKQKQLDALYRSSN